MINCIIVDDEPLAAKVIESYISEVDGLNLISVCGNAIEAFNVVSKKKVDLVFLDIKMPKISGIEFIKMFENPPKIIFTTAYREFALDGFDLEVVDYLLKPVSFERFLKAVNKVYKADRAQRTGENEPGITFNIGEDFVFIKSEKKMIKVNLDDLIYIEGLKDYVTVVTSKQKLISYLSLNYLADKLPENSFLRVHKSFIVSLKQIVSFSATEINMRGKTIPIGRYYKKTVLDKLNSLGSL